jgi:Leucine-rich repeat (LRR) protein
MLEEVRVDSNLLYDLKLTFRGSKPTKDEKGYGCLRVFDCSSNKIQHIEGLKHAPNLTTLSLANNRLTITRDSLNELISLQKIQHLNIEDNPL